MPDEIYALIMLISFRGKLILAFNMYRVCENMHVLRGSEKSNCILESNVITIVYFVIMTALLEYITNNIIRDH